MSKLGTRVALSALICLAIAIGIYTTVFSASPELAGNRSGSHLVSGAKVNLDHYRSADPAPASLQTEFKSGEGHNCESEMQNSSED